MNVSDYKNKKSDLAKLQDSVLGLVLSSLLVFLNIFMVSLFTAFNVTKETVPVPCYKKKRLKVSAERNIQNQIVYKVVQRATFASQNIYC